MRRMSGNRLRWAGLAGLALAAAGLAWLVLPGATPEGVPAPPVSMPPSTPAPPVPPVPQVPPELPRDTPPGSGATTSSEGGPVVGGPRTPSGQPLRGPPPTPTDWDALREATAGDWERAILDEARVFAAQEGLGAEDTEAIVVALQGLHADLDAIRTSIREGRIHPSTGREDIDLARVAARDELRGVLGAEAIEALRAHLADAHQGGGF